MENAAFLGVIGSVFTCAAGLGWYMARQFAQQTTELRAALDAQRVSLEKKIDDHETIDNGRHEDNLKNFGKMDVALARLGSNGWHQRH